MLTQFKGCVRSVLGTRDRWPGRPDCEPGTRRGRGRETMARVHHADGLH